MSKLTLHLQYVPPWFNAFVDRCGGKLQTVKGVNVYPNIQGVKTLGRKHLDDAYVHDLVMMGEAGVLRWLDDNHRDMAENPHVYAFFGPNEIVVDTIEKAARFNAFHVALLDKAAELGIAERGTPYKMAVGNTNTGWYHLERYPEDAPPFAQALKPTVDAVNHYRGIWVFHEYDWPTLQTSADGVAGAELLRYRYNQQAWEAAGCAPLQEVYIGETGLDSVVANLFPHQGYRALIEQGKLTEDGYLEMLKWYSRELDRDANVLGASVFTVCNWDWFTFDISETLAMKLADFIREDPGEPVEPEPEGKAKGLYLSKYQNVDVNWDALWRDGYRGLGLRVSGPDNPLDPSFVEVDPWLERHYTGAKAHGFMLWGFHYLDPRLPIDEQVEVFATAVAGKDFALGLYGDVEQGGLSAAFCDEFFTKADAATGTRLAVYGRKTQLDKWAGDWQEDRKLWLAAWTYDPTVSPYLPNAWAGVGYEWWQYSNKGTLPGVEPPEIVCLDVWRGTTTQLLEEYEQEEPVTEPVIDPRIASFLTVTKAPTGAEYRLKSVKWMDEEESAGLHHIFFDVVDTEGNRLPGHMIEVFWEGNEHAALVIEEKPGEPWGANFAMYATLGSYGAFAGIEDRSNSDVVEGMGLGTPEQPNFTIHTSFGITFVYGEEDDNGTDPEEPEPTTGVEIVDANGLPVEGLTWEDCQTVLRMQLTRATPPAGAQVYRLRKLMFITTDKPLLRVYTRDKDGNPIRSNLAFMGWEDGDDLPPDCAPHIAAGVWRQPEGRPNKALVYDAFEDNQTNEQGYVEWIWGEGQEYDPSQTKGPHWSWIRAGDDIYSDVIDGEGIINGDSMFWPVFVLETVEDDDDGSELPDDLTELLTLLVLNTDRIAHAVEVIAGIDN